MSWQKLHVGDLGRVVTGKTPPTSNPAFYDGGYPFVTPTDLNWQSYVVRTTHSTVTELARDRNKNQFIPANATVFTCIGNTIGKTGLSAGDCLTNQQINSVIPNDKHDPKFVYYLLNYHRPAIRSLGLGSGAAQPIINKSTFSRVTVATPATRDEEQRIASILSAYDDLIENNRRRIALLEEAARRLHKEWFVRFRFPGHEQVKIVGGVPEGWASRKIGDITTKLGSGATPTGGSTSYQDSGITLIRSQNVYDFRFEDEGLAHITEEQANKLSNVVVQADDILLNITGASVARCCQVLERHLPARVNQHVMIVRSNAEKCPPNFLLHAINSSQNKERLLSIARAGGATREALTKDIVAGFEVLIPSRTLLDAFDAVAAPMAAQSQHLSAMNANLSRARDLLLPKLMSGAIAV